VPSRGKKEKAGRGSPEGRGIRKKKYCFRFDEKQTYAGEASAPFEPRISSPEVSSQSDGKKRSI